MQRVGLGIEFVGCIGSTSRNLCLEFLEQRFAERACFGLVLLVARVERTHTKCDAFFRCGLVCGGPSDNDGDGLKVTALAVVLARRRLRHQLFHHVFRSKRVREEESARMILGFVSHRRERCSLLHHRLLRAVFEARDEDDIVDSNRHQREQ